ncbi:GTPase HflX [Olsenella sp. HMSC062G07]|uniref:GTPase HflX n=1 Tax=Olsenella sp. HMSC062G07 TaxID=1739330 RepID=UPI0008A280FD|nr:GTPase HflX [Olsenella sp. HMSC062G07]OFK24683.1 GTPase HflX [Olsenella sp. HMSC062G07]
MARFTPRLTAPARERAILVGVDLGDASWPLEDSLEELGRLAHTDGAEVVAVVTQRLERLVPRTFVGSGKAEEIARLARSLHADVVIFDDELSPSQQSNLERVMGEPTKVIDRTALILDIFGTHAKTHEGRLQVQLAQLQYVLPRLRGMWGHLVGEQTRGGIGSRFGQGESQLEVDRRLIRDRISWLRRELKALEGRRRVQSKARWDSGVYRVALVGYTNAGKSTLLNRLTGAQVYAKDELFATLDPTTRALSLDAGRKVTLTDTVGFIQKLPTTLVESFKSTLAEARAADLILRVADASDPQRDRQLEAVDQVLGQIGAADIPSLIVYNKCDLLNETDLAGVMGAHPSALLVSALDGRGLDALLVSVAQKAGEGDRAMTVLIPYDKGLLQKLIHERCQIMREQYLQEGLLVTARVPARLADTLRRYARADTRSGGRERHDQDVEDGRS